MMSLRWRPGRLLTDLKSSYGAEEGPS